MKRKNKKCPKCRELSTSKFFCTNCLKSFKINDKNKYYSYNVKSLYRIKRKVDFNFQLLLVFTIHFIIISYFVTEILIQFNISFLYPWYYSLLSSLLGLILIIINRIEKMKVRDALIKKDTSSKVRFFYKKYRSIEIFDDSKYTRLKRVYGNIIPFIESMEYEFIRLKRRNKYLSYIYLVILASFTTLFFTGIVNSIIFYFILVLSMSLLYPSVQKYLKGLIDEIFNMAIKKTNEKKVQELFLFIYNLFIFEWNFKIKKNKLD